MPEFDFEAGYKRVEKAMSGGSDEPAFIIQMHEFAMAHLGHPGHQFYTDPVLFSRGICQTTVGTLPYYAKRNLPLSLATWH